MLAMAARGEAREGDWLIAERQTAGRGRMGRAWESPSGNFYGSGLVSLRVGDPDAATLALVAAVAVFETLALWCDADVLTIKWPNDVLAPLPAREGPGVGRAAGNHKESVWNCSASPIPTPSPSLAGRGKLSGILLERGGDAVVVGVGVNLAHHPELPDRPATNLSALGVAAPEPHIFVDAMAEIFARWLGIWRDTGLEPVRNAWQEHAHPVGTALDVNLPDGTRIAGLFDGLTSDCALRLRLADGPNRVIHAGDVFLI